ncbi:hypothetical protein [Pedobacter sp. L105]|uniref:DUF7935 family protein n=1 Tax=Pedobacter sp. L105 TaxID=1641871 RepID=UPI00131C11DB|nr:hypothetical protein [Pedobacter sp. L105]
MNLQYFVEQVLILAAGGLIALLVGWSFIKSDIQKYLRPDAVAPVKDENDQLLQLRLQAHERLIIFTERLNPSNLFIRLNQQGFSARELQSVILHEIRSEYQHNVSQQLYINSASWNILLKLKEDTIALINNAMAALPQDASGTDLSKKVLEHLAEIQESPYALMLEMLKQDIHHLF